MIELILGIIAGLISQILVEEVMLALLQGAAAVFQEVLAIGLA